jgi:Uma2 family endonuclease
MAMAVATMDRTEVDTGVRRRLFSATEYSQLSKLGFFDGQKVELLDGEIYFMAAQGNDHTASVTLLFRALDPAFGPGFWVRCQSTLDLSPLSMPDPDIAVVVGDPASPDDATPTTALLVVEVSESSLATDRGRKASLYAAAGITDYWVVNLPDECLEVRRGPRPDSTADYGASYSSLVTLFRGEGITPLARPGVTVNVADVLPG